MNVSMSSPDVSVAIVNTSSRDLLVACLESLGRDEGRSVEAEFVVLDNASEDDSVEAVRSRFPWVRVLEQPYRAGFGANQNTVFAQTSGRYVYVLNEDTLSEPGSLDALVSHLDAHPRVGAVGPKIVYPDGRLQTSAWRFPSPARAFVGALTLGRAGVVQSGGTETRRVDWAMGCALMVRRAAVDDLGLFDERFFMYVDETDLCRRLADSGWETHYLPEVVVVHLESQFSASIPERRIVEHWRSRRRYWRKHHSELGARAAAFFTGAQFAVRSAAVSVLRRLPEGRRPPYANREFATSLSTHVRNAWFGETGPGLAELAREWNERQHVSPAGERAADGQT
jgi:hypothetical protein